MAGSVRLKKPSLALTGHVPVTSSVTLGPGPLLIQNRGPNGLYVQDVNPATMTAGVKVPSGSSLIVGSGDTYYAVSDGKSEVRTLGRGLGVFYGVPPA